MGIEQQGGALFVILRIHDPHIVPLPDGREAVVGYSIHQYVGRFLLVPTHAGCGNQLFQ